MEVRLISENQEGQWEEYIRHNPYAIAWQSHAWRDVLSKHYQFEYYPLAAFENTEICGVLPLYKIDTMFEKNALISVPYAVAGGIVADNDAARSVLLDEAKKLSTRVNASKIIFKHYKQKIESDIATDANFYNRELSLSPDPDELWHNIADNNKISIEEAEQAKPSLEYPFESLDMFFNLLLKHHHRMGIPCVSKKWIRSLIDSGMYSMAVLSCDSRIVAGTVVKVFKKTVSFPFTCLPSGDPEAERYACSLYWRLINYFARQGFEIFHSGRIPRTDQVNEYRLGWGGTQYGYYYQYVPDPGIKTEFATKRGKKRQLFEKVWKRTPKPVVNVLGPRIVRHFP